MSFNPSTILLVLVVVVPGLFAQRTRNQIVPRSFAPQGASAELAELIALGFATHGILIALVSFVLFAAGLLMRSSPDFFFALVDGFIAEHGWSRHIIESSLGLFSYIFLSFFVSHWLGFVYGMLRSRSYFTQLFFAKADWLLRRFGVTGLLGERPIIYEMLNPDITDRVEKSVYVEIELRDQRGFYSGQVSQYAIVKDEEPHKPIVLIDVWFRYSRDAEYVRLQPDSVMLDLADALTVSVRQVAV